MKLYEFWSWFDCLPFWVYWIIAVILLIVFVSVGLIWGVCKCKR